ncbi:hypothetical protein HJFPF1_06749 [Paramyrothecium foliicola]|nr:hypothetical protein HJFPF1_06749 [Paramyrothecium foliicola]
MSQPETLSQQHVEPQNVAPKPKKKRKPKSAKRNEAKTEKEPAASESNTTIVTETSTVQTVIRKVKGAKRKTHIPTKQDANDPREARHPPSEESGGVPEPTIKYLLQAQAPSRLLPEPRPILIVMDLNGTLLHRPQKRRPFHFIERPHTKPFISYCLDNFYFAIWSSARPDNVEKMVERLLTPEQVRRCILVWGRDKFGLSSTDYNSRVQCYKRLTQVWSDPRIIASHPAAASGVRWDQSNTVLVDDSKEKARSEPHNILQIPDFTGLANECPNVLPQVHDYLNTLCYQSDISGYVRENPFKLDSSYTLTRERLL